MQVTPKVIDFSCIMITHRMMQKNWRESANFWRQSPFLGQKRAKMAYFGPFCQNQTFFWSPQELNRAVLKNYLYASDPEIH